MTHDPTSSGPRVEDPNVDPTAPGATPEAGPMAVIIVDHGSRVAASNAMLEDFVALFASEGPYALVEAAHMELAEPSIGTAFRRCVEKGARRVVVMPYFLSPGRHWREDIPRLAQQAAAEHPGVEYLVGSPLGLHPLMAGVLRSRLEHCLSRAAGEAEECESCRGTGRCQFRAAPGPAAGDQPEPEPER